MGSVRVAVVQAGSVVMDGPASVDKACAPDRRGRGAGGARLISLPEGFVPLIAELVLGRIATRRFGVGARPSCTGGCGTTSVDVPGRSPSGSGEAARARRRVGGDRRERARDRAGRGRSGTRCCGSRPTAGWPAGTAS